MTKLKECPFCGQKPEVRKVCTIPTYCVACQNPKCHMHMVGTDFYKTQNKAIKAWNTRKPAQTEGLKEGGFLDTYI